MRPTFGGRRGENRWPDGEARLWRSVVAETNGCWLWTAATNRTNGYGRIRLDGKKWLVYRLLYERLVGRVPDGLELDHLCENKRRVNPTHLEPVTHQENLRRWSMRMTTCRRGHPRTPENVYVDPTRPRRLVCLICHANSPSQLARRRRDGIAA